ncbi:adhesion G protein-coupled receptor E2-like [Pseudorasbora parva]|uniref:adhesion G protein-coupled receptor E2-like n=1 Tax=Pseudorasbora parva TaxID=51549 RepID=UPI00351F1D53
MTSEGKIFKHLLGIIMAILLNHECVVETLNFSEISMDLQFNPTDEPVHHIRQRSADPVEYIMVAEIKVFETVAINKTRSFVTDVNLPFQVDNSTEITALNISTVCSLNQTQYQCKCEGPFVWPYDTCHSYGACDVITDGSCTCINALPVDGQFCQVPLSEFEYEIEMDVGVFNLSLVVYLKNLTGMVSLPLTLSNSMYSMTITYIDMTTVCGLNGTEYECKCEENHVWPNDTCRAYHECDAIVGGTCGCIQALPSEGPLCQRDINECAISPSVCGSDSTCTNKIGSYNCSCLDGFTPTNSNLTISINNTCTDVNECLKTSEFCGLNSRCTNSFGSYNCSCLSGFTVTNRNQPVSTSHPCNGEHRVLPSNYMIDIDVRFFDLFLENYSRNIIRNISLPLTLSNRINITDIDMTTVCGLNGTEYECKCEENHVWPNDTCRAYHECDAIVGGTCGCIQALPSEGPLCQKDINECAISPSVCGSYSTCTNKIGSYNCSCLDGFTATNSNLTISINNTCTDVNECLKTSEFCGLNSRCTNSFGSYNCSCLSGFTVTNRNQPVSTSNPCNSEHRVHMRRWFQSRSAAKQKARSPMVRILVVRT